MTGRNEVLVPADLDPERLAVIRTYCGSEITIVTVATDPATGRLDVDDLKLSENTAAVYLETPNSFGVIEVEAERIIALAREHGAEAILGVDPISLGVLAPPGQLNADIAVGSTQPLGVHMNCGGGAGGFIASRDEERYAHEYPTLNLSICDTVVPGERGFGITLFHQTSYGLREDGNDWTGNSTYLWSIAAATYMSLLGPQGFEELGELIVRRSQYAATLLGELDGVRVVFPNGFFKELVVNFDGTGKSIADVNLALRERRIFGGKDLSRELPELGASALYCVTEVHTADDVERLAGALEEVIAA
jgi:glycine dehydrogenase subunit 1